MIEHADIGSTARSSTFAFPLSSTTHIDDFATYSSPLLPKPPMPLHCMESRLVMDSNSVYRFPIPIESRIDMVLFTTAERCMFRTLTGRPRKKRSGLFFKSTARLKRFESRGIWLARARAWVSWFLPHRYVIGPLSRDC